MMVDTLRFLGRIKDGAGLFSELELPGRSDDIGSAISDWPSTMHPGSLNVQVEQNGYPAEFLREFGSKSLWNLDSRRFRAEAELDFDIIPNNTLTPTAEKPDRGRPQFWPARLKKRGTEFRQKCWVCRRRHSTMRKDTLECVAGVNLRSALHLQTDDLVELEVFGSWVDDVSSQ